MSKPKCVSCGLIRRTATRVWFLRSGVAPHGNCLKLDVERHSRDLSRHGVVWAILLVVLFGGSGAALGFGQPDGLPAPWQHKLISLGWSNNRSLPKVDHGYALFFQWFIKDGLNDAIRLISLTDGPAKDLPFWINGASVIWVNNVGVAPGQELVVVGSFSRSVGGAAINFIAETDMEGHSIRTVDTGTYEPELACAENDGSIWTFGQDWSEEQSDITYLMLRNYSPSGRLLKSYLENDSLGPVALNFSTRLHRLGGASGGVYLRCGNESVGVYVGHALTWAEVQLDDGSFQAWKVKLPAVGNVTGLALVGGHRVYCSFRTNKSIFVRGLFQLDLTQSSMATWEPIDGTLSFIGAPPESSPIVAVLGDDGPSLVYVHAPADFPKSDPVFFWTKP